MHQLVVTELHERHVLIRCQDEADPVIGPVPLEPGQLLVLATPGAHSSLLPDLPALLSDHLAGIDSVWLGIGGLAADTATAQRLAAELEVDVVAPDGGVVAMPGAALYAGYSAGGTGWYRLGSFVGARFPVPEWESWVPAVPVEVDGVVFEPAPCGLSLGVRAFEVPVNQRFPKVVVGAGASPGVVASLLGGLPDRPVMVVPAAPEVASHIWLAELAMLLSREVVFSAGTQVRTRSGKLSTIVLDDGGKRLYRPFPLVLRQTAGGGDQQVLDIASPPPGWERDGRRSYRLVEGGEVVADVVPSGLVLRAAGGELPEIAAVAPFDPSGWTLTLGTTGQVVGLPVLAAAEKLLASLPAEQRAVVRVRMAGVMDEEAELALDRFARRPSGGGSRGEAAGRGAVVPSPAPVEVSTQSGNGVPVSGAGPVERVTGDRALAGRPVTEQPGAPVPAASEALQPPPPAVPPVVSAGSPAVVPGVAPVEQVPGGRPVVGQSVGVRPGASVPDVSEPAAASAVRQSPPPVAPSAGSGGHAVPVSMASGAPRPAGVPAAPSIPVVPPVSSAPPVPPVAAAVPAPPDAPSVPTGGMPPIMTTSAAPVSTVSTVSGPPVVARQAESVEPVEAAVEPEKLPEPVAAEPTVAMSPAVVDESAPPAPPMGRPLAVPVRASTSAEQNRFTAAAGESFGEALAIVNAALATWPSMRVDDSLGAKADYVAVCLFLGRGDGSALSINGALRVGQAGVLDGQVPCLMSGIRRLPTHRRAVLRQGRVNESLEHRSQPGTVLTEPGFLAASIDLDVTVPDADLDVLIWPSSARRTSELMLGRPIDEAVFVAGARFKALAVRTAEEDEEDDDGAPVAPRVAVLYRELAPGETPETTELDERDLAVLAKLDSVLARRHRGTLRLVDDPDVAARLTTSMVAWQQEAADAGQTTAVAS